MRRTTMQELIVVFKNRLLVKIDFCFTQTTFELRVLPHPLRKHWNSKGMRRCAHVCSWAAIVHLRTTTRLAATTVQLRTTCKRLFAVSGMRCIQRSATRVPLVWHRPAANRRKPHSLEVRCFSKKRKEDEKSWAEIAEEAVDIAK